MKQVRVRWIGSGMAIIDGEAFPRNPGDEDFFRVSYARALVVGGKVELVPDKPKAPPRIEAPAKPTKPKKSRRKPVRAEIATPSEEDLPVALEESDERD